MLGSGSNGCAQGCAGIIRLPVLVLHITIDEDTPKIVSNRNVAEVINLPGGPIPKI